MVHHLVVPGDAASQVSLATARHEMTGKKTEKIENFNL